MSRKDRSEPAPDQTTAITEPAGTALKGEAEHASVQVLNGPRSGAIFPLKADRTELGRGPDCHVYLQDHGVSRVHACIVRTADGYLLEDLGSRNGTFCQLEPVTVPRILQDGDRITVGSETVLRFSLQDQLEHRAIHQTLELMNRDGLTQLLNRRYFDERLDAEVAFARRHKAPLHVMLVDLDHFKPVNDRHGHQAGDALLRKVAAAMEEMLRAEDLIARHGGDEFAICVRGIDDTGAKTLAERLRVLVEQVAASVGDTATGVSATVGVAALDDRTADAAALIAAADRAMYRAKELGRNRVALAGEER